jgi:N-acetylglucosaminyldiphosphoundecaprenol N-acetyl-beta-D-mannosaminyltransferase
LVTKAEILSTQIDVTNLADAVDDILSFTASPKASYICVANVHMCMEAYDSEEFLNIVNNANLVLADGRPIFWAQKILGYKQATHIRGQSLMTELCRQSELSNLRIGLYGGHNKEILDKVTTELLKLFPKINISYLFSPPHRVLSDNENKKVVGEINAANVDILFVGIGCPKQEKWMAKNVNNLSCVQIGVGAAFDFIAGEKKHAPKWLQKIGLEWLFRLLNEPRRLALRYLKQNPRFVYYFAKKLVKTKLS